jgi:hypothetical protein
VNTISDASATIRGIAWSGGLLAAGGEDKTLRVYDSRQDWGAGLGWNFGSAAPNRGLAGVVVKIVKCDPQVALQTQLCFLQCAHAGGPVTCHHRLFPAPCSCFLTPIAHSCKNFSSHCQVVFAGLGLDEDRRAAVPSVVH